MDEARRTRDACPANDKALESLQRTQAQAELHFLRAEFEEAGSLAAALRERHPPLSRRRIWMRPWMLSLLLAHSTGDTAAERSEEHTSELQSLMRISYDVFCLNKKKTNEST